MELRRVSSTVHDVIVVGAGQGGLSVSYHLCGSGVDHLVVDRGGVANSWVTQRWDSFCLVTPNWTVNLPGLPYAGDDPDGFMPRDTFVRYMQDWARDFGAPVREGVDVTAIRREDKLFWLDTSGGPLRARNVVVATATYQKPKRPKLPGKVPSQIREFHASDYKSPVQAAEGAVLVVGSGQTGCQVVEDFLREGREVYLCVARTGRLPRRYRGRDCLSWQEDMGMLERTPDMLDNPALRFAGDPHATGRDGGVTVSLYDFQRRGARLLGRLEGIDGNIAQFRDDLGESLRFADVYAANFRRMVDAYVAEKRIAAPDPGVADFAGDPMPEETVLSTPKTLDLKAAGIGTIVWATGFAYDFDWIEGVEIDGFGYPVTDRGASSVPGLYFCGLNWMIKRKSGILYGVAEDAATVYAAIAERLSVAPRPTTIHKDLQYVHRS